MDASAGIDTKSNNDVMTDDEDSDDDEFFEAQEEITPHSASVTLEGEGVKMGDLTSDEGVLKEALAEGVLKETEMKLLCTGKPLFIPITQVS